MERDAGRNRLDQRRDAEDEVACRCFLPQFAVHPQADAGVASVDLVRAHDPRPHRAEGVERLADQELLVTLLQVARGYVVEARVPEHVVERARGGNATPAAADDDHELGFVVDGLRQPDGHPDRCTGRDDAVRNLGEDDGIVGRRRERRVDAAATELGGVRAVVDTNAEDVAARQRKRCLELDRRQRERRTGRPRHRAAHGERLDQHERAARLGPLVYRERRDVACVGGHEPDAAAATPPVRGDSHPLVLLLLRAALLSERAFVAPQ
jgi:hypothetical protein